MGPENEPQMLQEAQRAAKQGRGYQQTIHDLQAALREVQDSQKRASLDSAQGTPRTPGGNLGGTGGSSEASGQLQLARSRSWQDLQAEVASSLQSRDSLQGELASLQTEHSALQVTASAEVTSLGVAMQGCGTAGGAGQPADGALGPAGDSLGRGHKLGHCQGAGGCAGLQRSGLSRELQVWTLRRIVPRALFSTLATNGSRPGLAHARVWIWDRLPAGLGTVQDMPCMTPWERCSWHMSGACPDCAGLQMPPSLLKRLASLHMPTMARSSLEWTVLGATVSHASCQLTRRVPLQGAPGHSTPAGTMCWLGSPQIRRMQPSPAHAQCHTSSKPGLSQPVIP